MVTVLDAHKRFEKRSGKDTPGKTLQCRASTFQDGGTNIPILKPHSRFSMSNLYSLAVVEFCQRSQSQWSELVKNTKL